MFLVAAFALALILALLLTPLGVRLAWVSGYLDHPEARKLHTSATALLGGTVVFVSALVSWLIYLGRPSAPENGVLYIMGGAAVVLLVGLWDDRFNLGVGIKLIGQLSAAGLLLASGLVPDLGLGAFANVAVTLLALVALMNAINFLDNMNGMVAGLSAIALTGFAAGSIQHGAYGVAAAQLALAGACAGFLRYNFPQARIFLGDAGSLLLGYSLGASAVMSYVGLPRGWAHAGPFLALAYPMFDIVFVVINRIREGRPVSQGGKDHSNHRLARLIQWKKTVLLTWLVGGALSASALVVQNLNSAQATLLLLALWGTFFLTAGLRLSSVDHQGR
jgi:UDP-GlcNAc:undecaprenyl-phosphate/decaprenyl-phosphate GlcNAc-1-phosphate transferase